jgi:lipopolysaccharide/colanic/teichoic acid biosynthesis glycosyltransferase
MHVNNDPSVHREYVKNLIVGSTGSKASNGSKRPVYKLTRDPRITKVGAFLRKTSLDELPQLYNVLKGEMSLVGPRPAIPYEVEAYELWHRRRVLAAKPGITGLWQVNGRSRVSFNDMVRLDVRYAMAHSLWLDVKILLSTPRAVIFAKGAY